MTNQLEITLTDTYGKNKTFALKVGRNGLVTKPIHTERGFGDSHTDFAEIDGFTVSGDVWRFFEGTLGVEDALAFAKRMSEMTVKPDMEAETTQTEVENNERSRPRA